MSTVAEIWNADGIMGFYRGIVPSLVLVSNPAIQYMSFEKLRDALFDLSGGQRVTAGGTFLLGALSKTLATVCTYPYILIKSRLQSRDSTNGEHYAGTLDVIRKMAARDGLASFYRGLSSKLVQSVATSALLFFTKDQLAKIIGKALVRTARLVTTPHA
jgi:solute carrier family 25 (peroxisomal adenine nucleotide transporter), member 17